MISGDVFRLLPMQQGLLFHSLFAEPGVYVCQVTCTLEPKTNLPAFEQAWRCIIKRHGIFRTSFHWQGLDEPVQREHWDTPLPFEFCNWEEIGATDLGEAVSGCLVEERHRGFDLSTPPLMRIKLVRLPSGEFLFVWTHHHALLDGRARTLVLREVSQCYNAFCRNEDLCLPPAGSFRDYVEWFYQQDFSASEEYWRRALKSFASPVSLALSTNAGNRQGGDPFAVTQVVLPTEVKMALKSVASKYKVTANIIVQVAWALLLGRFSGQQDIVFGETRACRRNDFKGAGAIVGLLMNTLPVRVAADPARSFAELLAELRQQHIDSRKHEHLSLQRISSVTSISATARLFDSIVVFDKCDLNSALKDAGGTLWREVHLTSTSHYPITIVGYTEPDISLRLVSYRAMAGATFESRLVGQFETLLHCALTSPEISSGNLSSLTVSEQSHVVSGLNATQRSYPQDTCVHKLFEEQAKRVPVNLALIRQGQRLTYEELNMRANQLAGYLRTHGIGPEARVGLCLERSVSMIVAILAVLKAGGAYVPLDPAYPIERLSLLAEEAQIALLLSELKFLPQLPHARIPLVCLDSLSLETYPTANLSGMEGPDNLAYVMYTSGSTGKPKGVAVTHRGVVRLLFGVDYVRLGEQETFLQLASLGFDASTFEMWGALLHGGRLVLYPKQELDLETLEHVLKEEAVTCLWLTASLFNLIIDSRPEMLKGVRQVLTGGEALSLTHVERALDRLPDTAVINGYGPTEGTTFTCCYRIPCPRPEDWESVPIGSPIANTRTFVLDSIGNPCAVGVTGELYIGGDGLARGYLNSPELTAQCFIPDGLTGHSGQRLYSSGDLVRWRRDGLLEFLGRRDRQLKIRGFRIEPGEVEAILREQEGVTDGAVIVHCGEDQEKRLVGYVVLEPGTTTGMVQAELCKRLPEYMVPSVLISLESLPLAPNGKLDRAALPAPARATEVREEELPRTAVEEVLMGIWSEVLRVDKVNRTDNFFALGGHSLRAMQVVSRIREAFKMEIPTREMFDYATIASLAPRLETAIEYRSNSHSLPLELRGMHPLRGSSRERLWLLQSLDVAKLQAPLHIDTSLDPPAPERNLAKIQLAERRSTFPLSFAQRRLWFLQQFGVGQATYNIPVVLRLTGNLHIGALERAIEEIIDRHEILRTTFTQGPTPEQVIHSNEFSGLPVVDLQQLVPDLDEKEVKRLVSEEVRGRFDLSLEPPIRARLLRMDEHHHVLMVTMHHIAGDAWSLDVFMCELALLYEAFSQGRRSPLPPLTLQYADYSVWQQQMLQGAVLDQQLNYWRKQLSGMPELLELPTVQSRPPVQAYDGAQHRFRIPPELLHRLQEASRAHTVTLFMTLSAAFQVLLHRYTTQEDIAIGTPISGRKWTETESLIGFFVNTLVLRMQFAGELNFQQVLGQARETALAAYANQDVPFEKLVEELQPERNLSRTPLFQAWFSLQNQPARPWSLPELESIREEIPVREVKFDLGLTIEEALPELQCALAYRTDLFDGNAMVRLAGHYQSLLESAIRRPTTPVAQLPMLTLPEMSQILREWNQTRANYSHEHCIHELFEEQVIRDPRRLALIDGDRTLTYEQLNRKANQVAHFLRKRGVRPEVCVPICMERSLEMVIGLLGILKAGGVYVPLDPELPQERLDYMIRDSGVILLLDQNDLPAQRNGVEVISMNRQADEINRETPENLAFGACPENLAYVIYTSGSTGVPKGVANEHRGVVNHLRWLQQFYPLTPADRTMQKTPYSFDVSVPEFFGTLMAGACLVISRPGGHKEPDYMVDLIAAHKITTIRFVPSMLKAFLEARGLEKCMSLKRVISSGESLPVSTQELFFQRLAGVELINAYGPTEAAVEVSHWPCQAGNTIVPIGQPAPNVQLYVLDRYLQPVPVNVSGELFISGPQVARGYLNQPELTADRFIPNPFNAGPGHRMYRTGDLVRWKTNGAIEFLGRLDHQIKLRGFRIEVGEIESVLTRHPAVREAVVLLHERGDGERNLVSYIVAGEGCTAPAAGALRLHLQKKLPDYMIPSAFVVIESLPRTASGKIDRTRLPAPDPAPMVADYKIPRTPVEGMLANIWTEVLNVARIGVHDNFFELGGHSLLALRLIARIRDAFRAEISLKDLFAAPTITDLAQVMEKQFEAAVDDSDAFPCVSISSEPPLSHNQEGRLIREWLGDIRHQRQPPFHIVLGFDWTGSFDLHFLERAINQVIERHQVLRASFRTPAGRDSVRLLSTLGPMAGSANMKRAGQRMLEVAPQFFSQALCACAPLEVAFRDLQQLSPESQESEIAAIVSHEIRSPFDYQKPPLMRIAVLKMSPQLHRLILTVHHLVADFWSVNILVRDLSIFYQCLADETIPRLPDLPIQYSDFAAWERKRLRDRRMSVLVEYWRKQWFDLELFDARSLKLKEIHETRSSGAETVFFAPVLYDRLKRFTQSLGITTYILLLAGLCLLLHLYSGKRKIGVWGQFANRPRTETQDLIGWFSNLHLLGIALDPKMTIYGVVDHVKDNVLEAHAHQEMPFPLLWATALQDLPAQDEKNIGGFSPHIVLDFHAPLSAVGTTKGPRIRQVSLPHQPIQVALHLLVLDEDDRIGITAHYAPQVLSGGTVHRLMHDLERILEFTVSNPQLPVSEAPLVLDI